MKKIILSALVIILLAASAGYYYVFVYSKNKKFDMENAESITIDASALVKSFQENEANANKLYLDKVLLVKGTVGSSSKTQAGENTVTLSSADPFSGVMATLDTTKSNILNIGDTIVIKGFCKGFLSDVVITNAIIE
jgi:flagellar basal body-associated protein FliL